MRGHPLYDVSLIGVSAGNMNDGAGHLYCNAFYEVPMGDDPQYWSVMRNITEIEKIQMVFVGSDEEALALSQHADELKIMGCSLCCSDYTTNLLSSNKYDLMSLLQKKGIPVGQFFTPERPDDIKVAAESLGYPEKNIVIKPKFGRGSKGFRIITDKVDKYQQFLSGGKTYITLDDLLSIFSENPEKTSEFMLTEYLPGDKYSIDMLVEHGRVICAVARNNGPEPKINPPTQLADVVFDEDLIQYTESVSKCMGYDYFVQIEVGRDDSGKLKLIETNIRLDATLPITTGVGVNFYHEMMTYALEGAFRESIPQIPRSGRKFRFIRYWQHEFMEINR